MMNPFPLTRPDGSIHAYACGRCGLVGGGGATRGPDPVTGFCCVDLKHSHADAERCCTCSNCGTPLEPTFIMMCAACDAKARAKREAEKARAVALPPVATPAPADDVHAIYDVVMEGGVRLEVVIVDDHGVFYEGRCSYRDATKPEFNRDFSEPMQRNPMACLTSVLFSVAWFLSRDIVSVTQRPS